MKNISTYAAISQLKKQTKLLQLFIVFAFLLLSFTSNLVAQVVPLSHAEMLKSRQEHSFNKAMLMKGKNFSKVSTLLNVQQADAVSNPLLQIIQSLVGQGVTVSNIQTTLPMTSDIYGSFSGGTNVIGMESGLLMTTGSVFNALGPNDSPWTSQNNGLPGYLVTGDTIGYDAAVISFDVKSSTSFLSFKYVFASEEYNEYVGSPFNDEFAFFITGPGIPPGTNIALIPGTNIPVTINNVNLGLNSQYYLNNDSVQNADPVRFANLEYDGLTKVLVTSAITVVPGATYTLTLVIQDLEDAIYDSGVFLEGGSITSDSCVLSLFAEKHDITCNGEKDGSIDLTYNGANGQVQFEWTNGATSEDLTGLGAGSYNVTVTDEKGCKKSLPEAVVINEPSALILGDVIITGASCGSGDLGSAQVSVSGGTPPYQYTLDTITNDSGIFTELAAGTYNYTVADSNNCSVTGSFVIPQGSDINCAIIVIPDTTVQGQAENTIFLGYGPQSVTLEGTVLNGTGSYTYDWGDAGTGQFITVSPTITTTYNLTVTDEGGCQSTCSVTINVIDVRCGSGLQKVLVCHKEAQKGWQRLCISATAVSTHLAHGDYLGICNSSAIASNSAAGSLNKASELASLNLKALPNPTYGYFTIQVGSNNVTEKITLRILDLNGREIEVKNNLTSGQVLQVGNGYKSGIYMVELTQGKQRVTTKLVKY